MGLSFAGVTLLLAGYSSGLIASALTSPQEVSGPLGESVSVPCHYEKTYQNNQKYWCKGAEWSACYKVVEITKPEAEKRADRVSIRDNRTECTFTVTMENLTRLDKGTYWCGINIRGGGDPHSRVHVTVLSDLSTAATVTNGSPGTANSTAIPTRHPQSSPVSILMVLLPVTLLILVLLLIGASLLARQQMLKRKEVAATTVSNEKRGEQLPAAETREAFTAPGCAREHGTQADASPEGDVSYAVVKPKPRKFITTASSPHSAQAKHSPERVENSNVVPGRTDIFYTTLKYPVLDEQAIYTNMDRTSDQPWEPTVYCEVKKK